MSIKLRFAGCSQHRAGGVAGLVHLVALRRALGDDAGARADWRVTGLALTASFVPRTVPCVPRELRTRQLLGLSLVVALGFALAGCGGSSSKTSSTGAAGTSTAGSHQAQPPDIDPQHGPFTYSGATGPAHWGQLKPAYAACSTGKRQSPIALGRATPGRASLAFNYGTADVRLEDTGHDIKAHVSGTGNTLTENGVRYTLIQFHFHAPSEHTVSGRQAAVELHFVNETESKAAAAVGVFIDPGSTPNSALAKLLTGAPFTQGGPSVVHGLNIAGLLPPNPDAAPHYTYVGSLTTPPCTEPVNWTVFPNSVKASAQQISTLTAPHNHNNRPLQPLNGRAVQLTP
jgi:carbonic anhydrase